MEFSEVIHTAIYLTCYNKGKFLKLLNCIIMQRLSTSEGHVETRDLSLPLKHAQ